MNGAYRHYVNQLKGKHNPKRLSELYIKTKWPIHLIILEYFNLIDALCLCQSTCYYDMQNTFIEAMPQSKVSGESTVWILCLRVHEGHWKVLETP